MAKPAHHGVWEPSGNDTQGVICRCSRRLGGCGMSSLGHCSHLTFSPEVLFVFDSMSVFFFFADSANTWHRERYCY